MSSRQGGSEKGETEKTSRHNAHTHKIVRDRRRPRNYVICKTRYTLNTARERLDLSLSARSTNHVIHKTRYFPNTERKRLHLLLSTRSTNYVICKTWYFPNTPKKRLDLLLSTYVAIHFLFVQRCALNPEIMGHGPGFDVAYTKIPLSDPLSL